MDNVTHTLTGLMLARSGIGGGKKGAAVMMMLAANAPDLDVVGGMRGALSYLEIHRGYAHSLACAPLVALAPLLLARLVARARISIGAYVACLIGVLSHLLLDWTNVYGIRLLLPFSARWLRLDITDIIDPWILVILIGAVAAPAFVGLVSSEVASRKVAPPVRGWALVALAAVLLYEGNRWVLHERATAILGAHVYGADWAPVRVSAMPNRINPWLWRGIVEGRGFVVEVPVDLWGGDFDPGTGRIDFTAQAAPDMAIARKTDAFRVFASFDQVPFWRVSPILDGSKVELIDLRFGSPRQPGFEAVATLDQSGAVLDSRFTFGQQR
jgi:inner membrane protein